jgi:biotin carboxylase
MVIKPTSGAGSLGVYKAFNEEELRDSVARALEDLNVTDSVLSYVPGVEVGAPIICEEMLIAKDFSPYPIGVRAS